MRTQSKAAVKAIPAMAAVYFAVAVLEECGYDFQRTNREHPLGPGFMLSLLTLVVGAFLIGMLFRIGSWGFVFGVGGALLFVPRFYYNSRLAVDLALKTETDAEVYVRVALWIVCLGLACRYSVWQATALKDRDSPR